MSSHDRSPAATQTVDQQATDLRFPQHIGCHRCGARCRVMQKEVYSLPEGVAGVAFARCRRCRHTFVRFIGEKKPTARLAEIWLGLYRH